MRRAAVTFFAGVIVSGCNTDAMLGPTFAPSDPADITVTETLIAGTVMIDGVESMACEEENGRSPYELSLAGIKEKAAALGATGIYKPRYGNLGVLECGTRLGGVRHRGIAIHDPRKATKPLD